MSAIVRILVKRPIIVGNVVTAVISLGALVGLTMTDASIEAVVAVVMAVLALVAAITAQEQARVSPVRKIATLVKKPVSEVNGLLKDIEL